MLFASFTLVGKILVSMDATNFPQGKSRAFSANGDLQTSHLGG